MRVRVYKNLHKDCYSVRAMEGPMKGLVIAHCNNIVLKDAKYIVSEKGRERVLRERTKNVHAFVEGYIVSLVTIGKSGFDYPIHTQLPFETSYEVTYNPYKFSSFVYKESHTPIEKSCYAVLNSNGIHIPCGE